MKLYNAHDMEGLRKAGRLASDTLDYIEPFVKEGVSTEELDTLCYEFIKKHNAIPASLNYKGFPKSTCISTNHVICHGIPSADKKLHAGDITNIDVAVILNGYYGDNSRMYGVGKLPIKAKRLMDVTYEAMWRGIEQVKPGAALGDIGHAIQSYAEGFGYSVVRDFCGHGTGTVYHDEPTVLHYGRKGTGMILKEGMVFTIEPMINIGTYEMLILDDGWTAITRDRSLSAQFEHTLAVTKDGYEVFTLSKKERERGR